LGIAAPQFTVTLFPVADQVIILEVMLTPVGVPSGVAVTTNETVCELLVESA
jgi:hypothetical protein